MPTILMFKKIGGYHNALMHEVEAMKQDGWEVVGEKVLRPEPVDGSFDYAIHKEGWKRVAKVTDTYQDALDYANDKWGSMDGVTIERRPRA